MRCFWERLGARLQVLCHNWLARHPAHKTGLGPGELAALGLEATLAGWAVPARRGRLRRRGWRVVGRV